MLACCSFASTDVSDIFCIASITERVKFPMIMFCALNSSVVISASDRVSSEFMIEVFSCKSIICASTVGAISVIFSIATRNSVDDISDFSFSESTRPPILSTASVSLLMLLSTGSSLRRFSLNVSTFSTNTVSSSVFVWVSNFSFEDACKNMIIDKTATLTPLTSPMITPMRPSFSIFVSALVDFLICCATFAYSDVTSIAASAASSAIWMLFSTSAGVADRLFAICRFPLLPPQRLPHNFRSTIRATCFKYYLCRDLFCLKPKMTAAPWAASLIGHKKMHAIRAHRFIDWAFHLHRTLQRVWTTCFEWHSENKRQGRPIRR